MSKCFRMVPSSGASSSSSVSVGRKVWPGNLQEITFKGEENGLEEARRKDQFE